MTPPFSFDVAEFYARFSTDILLEIRLNLMEEAVDGDANSTRRLQTLSRVLEDRGVFLVH